MSLDLPYSGIQIPEPELYLPESLLELFCVTPNFENGGTLEASVDLNVAARDWLAGTIDFYTYTDLLELHGLNPEEFVEDRLISYSLK